MREILLSQDKVTIVDDEDFAFLNRWKWFVIKDRNTYYARRIESIKESPRELRKTILMHRIIMSPPDDMQVDHINHNGLDNRKENLRVCTQYQNQINSRIRLDNTSGIKGVSWHKRVKKWRVLVMTNEKRKHLGYFTNLEEAKEVYQEEAKKHHKEFYCAE